MKIYSMLRLFYSCTVEHSSVMRGKCGMCDFERVNTYLMAIELCLNQSDELNSQFLLFLDAIEKYYFNFDVCLDVTRDMNAFKSLLHGCC